MTDTLLADHPFEVSRVSDTDLNLVAVTDAGLGNTAWVLDLDGEAVVVDPERDPFPYEGVAERLGAQIVYTVDTHLHADFITGSRELAAHGAQVVASAAADVLWDDQPMRPGDELDLGRWRLQALATPGHTPEHVAYLLRDRGRPRAVFTGGSLLVGAVARTDLIDPADTEALTRALWKSIHRELLALPDDVLVLPTHGAGSFCSATAGTRRWSTLGEERRGNSLLSAPDEDTFVRWVLDSFGSYPPYFLRLREVNRRGPGVLGGMPPLASLSPVEVGDLRDHGAVVVDVRGVDEFTAGHLRGALANTLRPQFGSWLSWTVPDPSTPLVFVTGDHTDRRELVRQCLNIGYENLAGELAGGVEAWRAAGGELVSTPTVDGSRMQDTAVVDVRQAFEFSAGHVPGAAHVELGALGQAVDDLPPGPLVVMCGHGERAATAASILESAGRSDVAVLAGGPEDWVRSTGRQLVTQ
ncbi:MAG TPA: rhodanese-like domain-containing protein [Acidimicrobiales bacterium]|nr:rhodanese-like domain-containing protein [Acidimicrobiales bacterium]